VFAQTKCNSIHIGSSSAIAFGQMWSFARFESEHLLSFVGCLSINLIICMIFKRITISFVILGPSFQMVVFNRFSRLHLTKAKHIILKKT